MRVYVEVVITADSEKQANKIVLAALSDKNPEVLSSEEMVEDEPEVEIEDEDKE
jgi:hypothetical protein